MFQPSIFGLIITTNMRFIFLLGFLFILSLKGFTQTIPTASDTTVYTVVEQMPEFPGGTTSLFRYLGKNIIYPEKARINGIEGIVFVSFVIGGGGEVSEVAIVKGVSPELDQEALRVVRKMPPWKPGKQSGKPVSVKYQVPIKFKQTDGPVIPSSQQIDNLPEFPGGEAAFKNYVKKNRKEPKGKKAQGYVLVEFVIDSTGAVKDLFVSQSLSPEYDAAALSIFRNMPLWKPASTAGTPVAVKYRTAVLFMD